MFLQAVSRYLRNRDDVQSSLQNVLHASKSEVRFPNSFTSTFLSLIESEHLTLVVTPTSSVSEDLMEELSSFIEPESLAYLPAWETLPHEQLSPTLEVSEIGRASCRERV